MPYEFYNPSPTGARIGDCVIRAICKALDQTWEHTYVALCVQGFSMYDLPNADSVWGEYLRSQGFQRHIIPNTCPDCYNILDFANEHPKGTFVLGTGTHAVTVQDGVIYDSWNSGNEIPIFYFYAGGICMRLLFTILQTFVIACGTFILGLILGLAVLMTVYIALGAAGLTILSNVLFRIRTYDGIVHIDRSQDNTVMQLEFCADPRCFTHKDELFFRVDTETELVKGRRSNNELVEKALDEIEEFH